MAQSPGEVLASLVPRKGLDVAKIAPQPMVARSIFHPTSRENRVAPRDHGQAIERTGIDRGGHP